MLHGLTQTFGSPIVCISGAAQEPQQKLALVEQYCLSGGAYSIW